jgi:hypothetical protein
MSDDGLAIPSQFWRRMTNQQIYDLMFVRAGRLTPKEIKLLWRLMKRTDKPPKAFAIVLDAETAAAFEALRRMNPDASEPPREMWDELGWTRRPAGDH